MSFLAGNRFGGVFSTPPSIATASPWNTRVAEGARQGEDAAPIMDPTTVAVSVWRESFGADSELIVPLVTSDPQRDGRGVCEGIRRREPRARRNGGERRAGIWTCPTRIPIRGCTSRAGRRGCSLYVLALVGLLVGCDGGERSWTMFPAPILMKDPRLDFTRFVAPEHRDTDVRVFYATTRAPAPEGYPERYTRRAGDAVRLGVAHVQLGEPGWSFDDLVESDRTSRVDALRPARVDVGRGVRRLGAGERRRARVRRGHRSAGPDLAHRRGGDLRAGLPRRPSTR